MKHNFLKCTSNYSNLFYNFMRVTVEQFKNLVISIMMTHLFERKDLTDSEMKKQIFRSWKWACYSF